MHSYILLLDLFVGVRMALESKGTNYILQIQLFIELFQERYVVSMVYFLMYEKTFRKLYI